VYQALSPEELSLGGLMYSPQYKCKSCEAANRCDGKCFKCQFLEQYNGDIFDYLEGEENRLIYSKPEPMTLERSAKILNEHRHNQIRCWHTVGNSVMDGYQVFTDFEAIAIAEKYERESK
jgi:hypothetical protein